MTPVPDNGVPVTGDGRQPQVDDGQETELLTLDGVEVTPDEMRQWKKSHENLGSWQQSQGRRENEIAERRREVEAEKERLAQYHADLRALELQLAQRESQPAPQPQPESEPLPDPAVDPDAFLRRTREEMLAFKREQQALKEAQDRLPQQVQDEVGRVVQESRIEADIRDQRAHNAATANAFWAKNTQYTLEQRGQVADYIVGELGGATRRLDERHFALALREALGVQPANTARTAVRTMARTLGRRSTTMPRELGGSTGAKPMPGTITVDKDLATPDQLRTFMATATPEQKREYFQLLVQRDEERF